MSDRPPDFFMRCVFEVVEPVEDARGTQNLKEYPEAKKKGLCDQVCGFCPLFELKIDEILERTIQSRVRIHT